MEFNEAIALVALKFKDISGTIRVISHLDADGLTSAAILAKTLEREGKHFNLTIVRSLTKEFLDELKKEDYKTFV
ncbi:MAG: single-stranded DNA endonuclease, partial [Nanoarchaeota archaeon]